MLRALITGVALALIVPLAGSIGLLAAWITGSPRPLYALAFPIARGLFRVAGIQLRVIGRDRLDPEATYVFVANHVSNVDPPVAFVAIGRNIRAFAKAAVFKLPVFGAVLRAAEFPPVHRKDRERSIRAVDLAAEALRKGHDFLVFAEGTRSKDGRLQAFKKGPFVMAIKAQVPVAPVVLRGTRGIQPKGSMTITPGIAEIEFLSPIPTRGLGFSNRHDLRDRAHDAVSQALAAAPVGAIGAGLQ